jgi:hypothetical protein
VRAHLALDEFEWTGAHHLLSVEFLASGIPARLTLHREVLDSRDALDKLRHNLFEMEYDPVIVNALHTLCHFPGYVLDGIGFRYSHRVPPEARRTRHGFRLGNEEDRMAYVPGGKFAPVLVEFDALT